MEVKADDSITSYANSAMTEEEWLDECISYPTASTLKVEDGAILVNEDQVSFQITFQNIKQFIPVSPSLVRECRKLWGNDRTIFKAYEIMIAMNNISPEDIFGPDTYQIWDAMEEYVRTPDLISPLFSAITRITLLFGQNISLPVQDGFDHPPGVIQGYFKSIKPLAICDTLHVLNGPWVIEVYTLGFKGIRTYEGYLNELLALLG